MENVSGEEIERALMDLGPLLGVTIKEEIPDELTDATAASTSRQNVNSLSDGTTGSGSAASESSKDNAEGADSLASPGASPPNSILNTRCVFCQNLLTQLDGTPKLMECLHSACESCIKQKIEEKQPANRDYLGGGVTITCPVCRLQCHPHNMIDQRFIIEKVTAEQAGNNTVVSGDQQCNSCEDTEPATSYCVDCAEFICDNCVHAHQRLKITKDHTIKSKEEAVAELQATQLASSGAHEMNCSEHPQERLSLFCETCDRLTCRDCQLQHHRDHKYQFTSEMAVQAREAMSSLRAEVRYKRQLLGSAMKVIHDRQTAIGDKKKALVHDITTTVVKLTNAINTRGKQLVLRLNEVCDAKQRTLSEKKEALEQLATITDHCLQFVEAALRHGSDTAVLHSKRAVCGHLQRIKARRADIPNPDIPVRITLALDKLPELLRVLGGVGAIVVDGKVDGAGPYRPPSPAPPPNPAPPHSAPPHSAPPHSAVVALQHVAMQQSYVQSRSGGASPVGAVGGVGGGGYLQLQQQMRARAHTPLRHPHVTSTTHPHHLHGMNELNLRGLLAASAGGPASRAPHPPHPAHPSALPTAHPARTSPAHAAHQMQHAYHHMMGAYGATVGMSGASVYAGRARGGGSGGGPRAPSPAPHYPPPAKWHIPQQLHNGGFEAAGGAAAVGVGVAGGGAGGADFKITLGRPPHAARAPPSAVTSTNPKTPSPSLNGGVSSELDKVCAESVQDLMATIAKLDSNGVQVLPEHATVPQHVPHAVHAASPAPHVHSSTDDQSVAPANRAAGPAAAPTGGADPNEDWCAVCMDGGELMCCDKCPKVFHQYCHIPTIEKLPDETETWQCLLCVNFAELPPEEDVPSGGGLSPRTQKIVERITLELYCQYECSLPFREPVPPENLLYHSKISRPMCLDMIRMKLQPTSPLRYTQVAHFVSDCRLLFRNAYHFNPPDTQLHKDARRLEEFFDAQLLKWLPEYAYWSGEGEIDPSQMAKRPRLH